MSVIMRGRLNTSGHLFNFQNIRAVLPPVHMGTQTIRLYLLTHIDASVCICSRVVSLFLSCFTRHVFWTQTYTLTEPKNNTKIHTYIRMHTYMHTYINTQIHASTNTSEAKSRCLSVCIQKRMQQNLQALKHGSERLPCITARRCILVNFWSAPPRSASHGRLARSRVRF